MNRRWIYFLLLFIFSQQSYALLIYAHRGGRGLEPENTLLAYRKALAIGVNFVDMDINMTKEGVLVVTHNFALNPDFTRNQQGHWIHKKVLIKSLTLKQLQDYNVCSKKSNTVYAKLFPQQATHPFCRIPTLKQVIDYVKRVAGNRVGFQIEIKTDPLHPEQSFPPNVLAKAVVKIIHQEKITNTVEVQAFDFRCLRALNALDPKIKTAYLTQYNSKKIMLNKNPNIASMWTGGPLLKNYHGSIPFMIARLGGKLWDPQDIEVTPKAIKSAHLLGLKVVVWGWPEYSHKVFDDKLIHRLIQWKVNGIITDRPDQLRALMIKLGMPVPPKIKVTQ